MNLISIKKEIRLSAKEEEERNKKPKSEEGKVVGNLLKASEKNFETLVQVH